MDEINWQAALQRCLESTHYCALATVGIDGAWSNPVFFSYDDSLTLLFISRPSSLHMKNIDHDQNVAVAIFSTNQPPGEHVISIQMSATAKKLVGEAVKPACARYFARPGAKIAIGENQPDPQNYQGTDDQWQFVQLKPTGVWLFDTEHFGEERVAVPDQLWRQK